MNNMFYAAVKAFKVLDNLSSELKKEAERKDGQPSLRFPGDGEAMLYQASAKQLGLLAGQLAVFTSEKESIQVQGRSVLGPWDFYRCELCSLAVSGFHDYAVFELAGSQFIVEDGIEPVALFCMFDLAAVDLAPSAMPFPNYIETRIAKFWRAFWKAYIQTIPSPEQAERYDAEKAAILATTNEPMSDDPLVVLAANNFALLLNAETIANPEGDMYAYNQFRNEHKDPEPSGWARIPDDSE